MRFKPTTTITNIRNNLPIVSQKGLVANDVSNGVGVIVCVVMDSVEAFVTSWLGVTTGGVVVSTGVVTEVGGGTVAPTVVASVVTMGVVPGVADDTEDVSSAAGVDVIVWFKEAEVDSPGVPEEVS